MAAKKSKSISEIMKVVENDEKKQKNIKVNPLLSHTIRSGRTKNMKNNHLSDYEKARVIKEKLKKKKSSTPKTQVARIRDAKKKYIKYRDIFKVETKI